MRATLAVDSRISIFSVFVTDMDGFSMHIPVTTKANNAGKIRALINSGAQRKFINKVVTLKLGLKEIPLRKNIPIYNVDGTPNKLGQIRTKVELPITIRGRNIKEELYVTHLGKNEIILGFD